jgi:hypothetical protein
MRSFKNIVAGIAMSLLLSAGVSYAGTDLNEVGAFLVYPAVIAVGPGSHTSFETFISITNAGPDDIQAHVSYINGDEESEDYCFECDFGVPLTPHDTELLVLNYTEYGTAIESEDRTVTMSCDWPFGFITASVEDENDVTLTTNVLLGSETVVNYDYGYAFSIPAIPFQGRNGGNGDRVYGFNDSEYGKFPRLLAADFIAPDLSLNHQDWSKIRAFLVLFTLNFERQYAPVTDCSVTGYDAAENDFSASFIFGCWTYADLCEISPEFCYPNLGLPCDEGPASDPNEPEIECDTHGWLKLDCRVRQDPNLPAAIPTARGAVHGALIQIAGDGAVIRRNEDYPRELKGTAAWARLLFQSVTTGDNVTLHLEAAQPPGGLD